MPALVSEAQLNSLERNDMKLTEAQIHKLLHGNRDWSDWVQPLQEMLPKYDIDTPNRIAMFMAQCGHESNNFRVLKENLNYSADALNALFSKYFERSNRDAQEYHRNPEKIANVIYANRMGNGDPSTGDGWKHRGKGAIQLTGKNNQSAFADSIGKTVERAIEHLNTNIGAVEGACWFWKENNLNNYSDDVLGSTKRINGGTIGLADRKHHYHNALEVLGGKIASAPRPVLIKMGSEGPEVREIQEALGLEADGFFGGMTLKYVKVWQTDHGLEPDGIVGPKTYGAMIN